MQSKKAGIDSAKVEEAISLLLNAIGEDPGRDGLRDTPARVARFYTEMFSGLHQDPRESLGKTFSAGGYDEPVLVRDIPFYSICEHHLVPFFGRAHVGYIPGHDRIVGISKIARLVDCLAKRPQVQERLTSNIADILSESLGARGVVAVIRAEHLCMCMRGVRKPGTTTVTYAMRGVYAKNKAARAEIISLMVNE